MSTTAFQGEEKYINSDMRGAKAGAAIGFRKCVKYDSNKDEIIHTTAADDIPAGIAENAFESGQDAQFIMQGDLLFIATGTIAFNDPICPDNAVAGNMRKAVSGETVVGRAITTAGDGEYCLGSFNFINPHTLP